LRIFERAFEYEPGDRADIDRGDFESKTHRFERDRAAAGERIEHARGAPAISLANFISKELDVGTGLTSPMEDATDGLLPLDLDRLAAYFLPFDFRNDAPAYMLDESAPLLGIARIRQ
jgi:hypothetical protein